MTDDSSLVDEIEEYALGHLASNASGACAVTEGGVTVCEESAGLANATNSSISVAVYSSLPADGIVGETVGDGDTSVSVVPTGEEGGSGAVLVAVLEGEAAEVAVDGAAEGATETTLISGA